MSTKLLAIAALCALMAGCATSTVEPLPTPEPLPPDRESVPVEPQPPVAIPEQVKPAPAVAIPNQAVESLIRLARSQYQGQNYQAAIATAERGLRIDRRSADLYLLLAQSYVQLSLPQKAKMFVQQGLRYAQQGSEAAIGLARVQEVVGR